MFTYFIVQLIIKSLILYVSNRKIENNSKKIPNHSKSPIVTLFIQFMHLNYQFGLTKNYTSNFADSPFGPDYCSSSNASLIALSISTIFQCILKIFQIIVHFKKLYFFLILNILQIQTDKYQILSNFA